MRFEIEADIDGRVYQYVIAFDLPERFRELRVAEERLAVDGEAIYSRREAQVQLAAANRGDQEVSFRIDWHLAALPIVQEQSRADPLYIFKQWLARLLVLRPMPAAIEGTSSGETLRPDDRVTNFGAWFAGLLAEAPSAYTRIDEFIKEAMPDFKDAKNPLIGKDSRSIEVQFSTGSKTITIPFNELSDGEKCFFVCALVLAAQHAYGPLTCFWDEPDNYLAPPEVGQFVTRLRQAFRSGSQFIATSHNEEAIRRFSSENTLYLTRRNHLEPTMVRPVEQIEYSGDLVGAFLRDDLEA